MRKMLLLLACTASIAACGNGTNPLTDPEDGEDVGGLGGSSVVTGEVNRFEYDADNDQLVINNLPFDGPDGVYENTGLAVVSGFGVYESAQTDETGQRKYFAVFRQSDSGAVSAGAVGTGDYAGFGFGGAAFSRSSGSVNLPNQGEAVYTGEYGGLRVISPGTGGTNDIQLVSGDARLEVDFGDFDVTGAVEGFVTNREYFDVDGNSLGTLPTIILATAEIGDGGAILESNAVTLDSFGDELQSGTWQGLFGGDNGEEIAGVIVITGAESEGATDEVLETGVITVID